MDAAWVCGKGRGGRRCVVEKLRLGGAVGAGNIPACFCDRMIVGRAPCPICWACLRSRWTTTAWIAAWRNGCLTNGTWKSSSRSGSANCSAASTTCCCTLWHGTIHSLPQPRSSPEGAGAARAVREADPGGTGEDRRELRPAPAGGGHDRAARGAIAGTEHAGCRTVRRSSAGRRERCRADRMEDGGGRALVGPAQRRLGRAPQQRVGLERLSTCGTPTSN